MRIAYLTSADMVPGTADARDDLFELELQWASLAPACAARGLELSLQVWDHEGREAGGWHVEDFDAVVIGTTWDYQERAPHFLERVEAWGCRRPVLNPPAVLRWNADKRYLRDLDAAGVVTVPTVWADRVDAAALDRAFDALGTDRLVAKPVVGACAVRQIQVGRGEPLPPPSERPPGAALIQPFLPGILDEGELSFVFCGGALSHALVKRPGRGDYRVQSVYGGREEACVPAAADVAVARAVLDAVPGCTAEGLLYARVDLVRHQERLRLMELELIEPYLYPEQGPALGERFAAALALALQR